MTDASIIDTAREPVSGQPKEPSVRDYVSLLKPRVMSLSIFTALVGMLCAPASLNPVVGFAAILCIAVGAGASGALNMWWDADIDAKMRRTAGRPIPDGRMAAGEALAFGLALSVLSVMMLAVFTNPLAGGLLAFTIFFYVVIYSMWLKRSTPQNIVIGGLAGALPPLVGWAAATGSVGIAPLLMVGLIFMWTPPHFWALALFAETDYEKADVPMLPNVAGDAETRRQILIYALLLAPVAIAPAFTVAGGPLYLAVALYFNARFAAGAWRLRRRDEAQAKADKYAAEKAFFRLSLHFLFWSFAALLGEAALRAALGDYAAAMQLF
ncbi:heme o synthase [Albimonas pacifica]|uniref:Protoheme IX farnesyltransferase n=1 Tax=Albimonas pacifica TaxID=1114924 RepID=A0A1I3LZE3_9RHOB|nr:heme o synthase [Albimonas pacifica]SFI89930.1 protoheme IX farnesyltransferase [Albimonas pacifica]